MSDEPKFLKRKIAKPLVFKGLAIVVELNSYPEPIHNRDNIVYPKEDKCL